MSTDLNKLQQHESYSFTMQEAIKEAKRCLHCRKPSCIEGCPINNYIPDFIHELSKGNLGEARNIIAKKSNLPAICGRVCPHEKQCQGHCILNKKGNPIKIGMLEQFIADFDAQMNLTKEKLGPKTRGKVAVIGSGPAGLTVAGDLSLNGFEVVVYEAEAEPGGILLYGIPNDRLPKDVVRHEIKRISEYGVTFKNNCIVGQDITIYDMFNEGFDAIFIGTGTAISKELNIPNKDLNGIIKSHYFLKTVMLYKDDKIERNEIPVKEGEDVLVIGAGNVAMDTSRMAANIGAKSVTVVTIDKFEDMPAIKVEYDAAVDAGVNFFWEVFPIEYVGENNKVIGLKVKKDEKETIFYADKILIAIGARPASRIVSTTKGIEVNQNGYIITKEKPYGMTKLKGVFAGGDVVHQPATVVLAMKEAKKVVEGILSYVDAKKLLDED